MKKENMFLMFGVLQSITLGLIIFFVLRPLGSVGMDTQIMLSVLFPAFLLVIQYMIYSKK